VRNLIFIAVTHPITEGGGKRGRDIEKKIERGKEKREGGEREREREWKREIEIEIKMERKGGRGKYNVEEL
jgi:hypothetical protein